MKHHDSQTGSHVEKQSNSIQVALFEGQVPFPNGELFETQAAVGPGPSFWAVPSDFDHSISIIDDNPYGGIDDSHGPAAFEHNGYVYVNFRAVADAAPTPEKRQFWEQIITDMLGHLQPIQLKRRPRPVRVTLHPISRFLNGDDGENA